MDKLNFYTYKIESTLHFTVSLVGQDSILHTGGTSIGKLVCTQQQLQALTDYFIALGVKVEFFETPRPDEETETIHREMLGKGDAVYPHVSCANCSWFDPEIKSFCWLSTHTKESIQLLMKKENYKNDKENCPVPYQWTNNSSIKGESYDL